MNKPPRHRRVPSRAVQALADLCLAALLVLCVILTVRTCSL